MVLFGVIPTGLAMFDWFKAGESTKNVVSPIFRDYATLCLGFVSLPLLIAFLWTERALIPQRLLSIHDSGVLRPKRALDTARWELRFREANWLAQALGICTGVCFSCVIYHFWMRGAEAVPTWQIHKAHNILWTGWLFLIWQMPLFWCACTVYVVRAMVTVTLLRSVVKTSEVTPRPFHPDRAGGLSDIAKIGLRNQYILAAFGVHLVCAFLVARTLSQADRDLAVFLVSCVLVATGAYGVAGPYVFIAPLLPFRKSMLNTKTEALGKLGDGLQRVVDAVVGQLPKESPTAEQEKEINRLRGLTKLVQREPVWPFDTVTLRRFFTAYLVPVLAWVLALAPIHSAIEHPVDRARKLLAPQKQQSGLPLHASRGSHTTTNPPAPSSAVPQK